MRSRKMVKLNDLSPEARGIVEAEVERRLTGERFEKLLAGNKRLLDAACAVNDNGNGEGAVDIFGRVLEAYDPPGQATPAV